jgi:hypothetical protein
MAAHSTTRPSRDASASSGPLLFLSVISLIRPLGRQRFAPASRAVASRSVSPRASRHVLEEALELRLVADRPGRTMLPFSRVRVMPTKTTLMLSLNYASTPADTREW